MPKDQRLVAFGSTKAVRIPLPHRPQRHPGPLGNPRGGRAQVTLGMQRAHRVNDRPAGPVRPGGPAIRRLAVTDQPAVAR